jgi:hypothetical protein
VEYSADNDRNLRAGVPVLWDPFDPSYLRDAFNEKAINLGHLIFGSEKWETLNGPLSAILDPLSDLYSRRGMFFASTYVQY